MQESIYLEDVGWLLEFELGNGAVESAQWGEAIGGCSDKERACYEEESELERRQEGWQKGWTECAR